MTPQAQFPTQFRQANAAPVTHLLKQGAHPSNIVLCGESAGGNLALQVILHILHPLPDLPPPSALSAPLGVAELISPTLGASRTIPFAGEHEGLFDPIVELGDVLATKRRDVKTVIEPGSPHDSMLETFMGGKSGEGTVETVLLPGVVLEEEEVWHFSDFDLAQDSFALVIEGEGACGVGIGARI
ncbi:hypothetical protein BC834DRAFT_1041487 [Gloeopeniophorella convolvens]|nr:hypothetical protein BC834DRAFT_1041487 [Gloeopeniophorella convolvens]